MNADRLLAYAGITYRRLDYWCTKGYLAADKANPGSGYARQFTVTEAQVARTMRRLIDAGVKVDVAHSVARGQSEIAPGIRVVIESEGGGQP